MRRREFLVTLGAAATGLAAPPSPARAAERGPIKIGYFAPITGTFSQTGKDMTDGFMLFWDEVGNQVAGRKIEVIVEDTEGVPATALTKVRRLVEQAKVHTVAGGLLAATGYAIAPYVEQNKIPTIYPVMAPDDITQRKPARWVVRTAMTGSQLTHALGDYAYKVMGLRRVATISMDYAYGWESNGGFQRVFEELGGKVVQRIWTPLNVQDYGPYLGSLKKDIDGVFGTHTGGLSPRFIKQWNEFGLKGKYALVGTGTLTDENILKGLGDEALGIITTLQYSAVVDNPANKKFSAAYSSSTHPVSRPGPSRNVSSLRSGLRCMITLFVNLRSRSSSIISKTSSSNDMTRSARTWGLGWKRSRKWWRLFNTSVRNRVRGNSRLRKTTLLLILLWKKKTETSSSASMTARFRPSG